MSAPVSFIECVSKMAYLITRRWSKDCRLKSTAHVHSVYDIVLRVYERFRVDRWKRYVNDDRYRVDEDKNMRLLSFAFTIVCVYNRLRVDAAYVFKPSPSLCLSLDISWIACCELVFENWFAGPFVITVKSTGWKKCVIFAGTKATSI